ncbi:hypothetical protein JZ751_008752 [Albula glossodonta]|uniref:Interferon-induced very large GTPase 1-like n=1 Tax=Albula glossodonta TaxID=121402 RepID=A0A8T2P7T9_9TELE|nr:hypothetical protein JZ751_008752 [Albula glossodonta]
MDCPGCSRTCGQNDKFCSECGFNLRSVRSTFIAFELAVLTTQSRTPTVESNSQARRVTEPPDRGAEITGNEQEAKCEAQSGVESVNEQQGKTLAEHRTNKPATDADTDCLNEVTDSRSSLGQEPETASLYLTQSEPSTACLPKPDPKSGLTATDNVDPTMSKNKDTAQGEEEGTVNEEKGAKSGSQEKEETLDETADTHATDSDSSIDLYQEPAPETSSLGKSEPSTACPAKMDPKNDLTDSDSVDQGMSKDSKHTAQEEEEMEFEDASEYLEEQAKEAEDSKESMAMSADETISKESVPMEGLTIEAVTSHSVSLSWRRPADVKDVLTYMVSYYSLGNQKKYSSTTSTSVVILNLKPAVLYTFTVKSHDHKGCKILDVSNTAHTELSVPGKLKVDSTDVTSATLSWSKPHGMEGTKHQFLVTFCSGAEPRQLSTSSLRATLSGLQPGTEYTATVSTVMGKRMSAAVSETFCTKPSPPQMINITSLEATSVTLAWGRPSGMKSSPHKFRVTWSQSGRPRLPIITKDNQAILSELKPGSEYTFSVCTVLDSSGVESTPVLSTARTNLPPPGEITIHRVKQDSVSLSWALPEGMENLPQSFKVSWVASSHKGYLNVKKQNGVTITKLLPGREYQISVATIGENSSQSKKVSVTSCTEPSAPGKVKAMDVKSTSVRLCWETPVGMEGVSYMIRIAYSCEGEEPRSNTHASNTTTAVLHELKPGKKYTFHITAVLPNHSCSKTSSTHVCTKTSLGDLVCDLGLEHHLKNKLSLSTVLEISGETLTDESVQSLKSLPWCFLRRLMMVNVTARSVRCITKEDTASQTLDNLLDTLNNPEGNSNVVNPLDLTSGAVFVFCDDFGFDCTLLNSEHMKGRWFLVCNLQSKSFNKDDFRRQVSELQLQPGNIIMKSQQLNDAEFVTKLRSAISEVLKGKALKMSIEQMSAVAHEFGIPVDEDNNYCQRGKQKADEITSRISDIPSYKEKELPLQGTTWKQIAKLEKEMCRLKKAGEKNLEIYKNELLEQKQKLWGQQLAYDISGPMSCFTSAMSSSKEERAYFLKWMRINLDNLSRKSLSSLRDKYKQQCKNSSENKELIAELDRKISSCSLGTEHFLREMGQLYESACSLPEGHVSRQQMQHLPGLCAELLLEGFPLELVDGDASNIPLQWVSRILKELHHRTRSRNKIRVVTVLGVQSTGKSTLLNTMFGVQFAVSSGRCTRGAFMLLIRVKEDFKKQLGCDYIMVIDTEGLKSPELAQLDDSYEHDNELATLVVGLSDITVINIAMENSTEMKDILQIVVHAFLRMKEVGKKPCCQFVHQNVPDISAHDKNMRDRKLLLEQLNEMTQAAAKMEKRGNNKKFTDVMVYDPERNNWYIPGLWHGNPPMAPVNAGYSESVYAFKRSMIEMFKAQESGKSSPQSFSEFTEWTRSLWEAVKYENFIFSFRNSLVADAYAKLCTEYNKWEWVFRKNMFSWLNKSETKISNFGTRAAQAQPSFNAADLLSQLKSEASLELSKGEKILLDNLTEYFERPEGHVHLVEKYKEDFFNTAKSVRRETENSVKNKLEAAVEIRKGMFRLEDIKKNHAATMEQKPDSSIQASDYWKYVFATFNKKFSKEYEAEPADIPLAWRLLTKKQAMKSLEETFKTKKHDDE